MNRGIFRYAANCVYRKPWSPAAVAKSGVNDRKILKNLQLVHTGRSKIVEIVDAHLETLARHRRAAESLRRQVALFWKVLSAGNAARPPTAVAPGLI